MLGGGIIGCATAYYLTRHPSFDPSRHTVTIIEAAKIGNGASGKAGGLLASWAYPSNLAELSFDLHDQLAKEHNGVELWGYRRVRCGQLTAVGRRQDGKVSLKSNPTISLGKWWCSDPKLPSVLPAELDWIDPGSAQAYEELADQGSTAQVLPLQFTTCIAKLAEERGTTIVLGTVEAINCGDARTNSNVSEPLGFINDLTQKKVVSVTYTDKTTSKSKTIPTPTVILAAGPWTPTLFPKVQMSPLRAHSVTIKLKQNISAYCLFSNITLRRPSPGPMDSDLPKQSVSSTISSEIYARPNNEVYICSQGDSNSKIPPPTAPVEVSSETCQEIIDAVSTVSEELRQGQVTSRRACYLPVTTAGICSEPLIGQTDVGGLILATRHSCWGILNAPATGKAISELVLDGRVSCADISSLDPRGTL